MTMTAPREVGPDGAGTVTELDSSWEDLYENAPCGYLSATADGRVVRVNATLLAWTGYPRGDVLDRALSDLLSIGSRLFYETRCLPVLRLEGEVREVSLDMRRCDGTSMAILANFTLRHPGDDRSIIRMAILDATGRRGYERELLRVQRAAEQSEARVRVLQQAAAAFAGAKAQTDVTRALETIAGTAFDASTTAVLLLDPATGELGAGTIASYPLDHPAPEDISRPEAAALRSGTVVTIGSLAVAKRTFPSIADPLYAAQLEAMTAAPLLDGDSPLGVLVCFFGRPRDFSDDEVELQRALTRLAAQVLGRIRLQDQLRYLALHDQLTGLANREVVQFRLAQVLSDADRHGRPMALIFLDLDGFKAINDGLGHAVGDSVLVQVADRLRDSMRGADTVARFGGDEFVVVCEGIDRAATVDIACRVLTAVRAPLLGVPAEFPLSASIGIALHDPVHGPAPAPDAVVREADAAMYRAKRGGKDRYEVITV